MKRRRRPRSNRELRRRDEVEARHEAGDEWYAGVIEVAHGDGSYDVLYDDGDRETNVSADLVKREARLEVHAVRRGDARRRGADARDGGLRRLRRLFDDFEEPPAPRRSRRCPSAEGDDARQLDSSPSPSPRREPAPAPAPVDPPARRRGLREGEEARPAKGREGGLVALGRRRPRRRRKC